MTTRSTLLTLALVAATSNAASNVMDTPIPFSIFPDGSDCGGGQKLAGGIISSVTPLAEFGHFCENTIQFGSGVNNNQEETTVYTKVVLTSCDAMDFGFVFLDAYTCSDAACSDCTNVDGVPVPANLIVPQFKPLPAADACWGIKADSTGVTVFNQFEAGADKIAIDTYWNVYKDNSCLKDTVVVLEGDAAKSVSSSSSSTTATAVAFAATMAIVATTSLVLN